MNDDKSVEDKKKKSGQDRINLSEDRWFILLLVIIVARYTLFDAPLEMDNYGDILSIFLLLVYALMNLFRLSDWILGNQGKKIRNGAVYVDNYDSNNKYNGD